MSNRLIRINELIQREISAYLRKRYQSEAACLTILSVQVSSDLKTGKVFVSIIGSDEVAVARLKWLKKISPEIRHEVGRNVVLKWTPLFDYILDDTPIRAARILNLLDEIEAKEKAKPTPPAVE